MSSYMRCIGCGKEWDARVVNDIGICAWCRLGIVITATNPFLPRLEEQP